MKNFRIFLILLREVKVTLKLKFENLMSFYAKSGPKWDFTGIIKIQCMEGF